MKQSTKMLLMNQGREKGRHFGFEYDDWKMKDYFPYPDRVEVAFGIARAVSTTTMDDMPPGPQ